MIAMSCAQRGGVDPIFGEKADTPANPSTIPCRGVGRPKNFPTVNNGIMKSVTLHNGVAIAYLASR